MLVIDSLFQSFSKQNIYKKSKDFLLFFVIHNSKSKCLDFGLLAGHKKQSEDVAFLTNVLLMA